MKGEIVAEFTDKYGDTRKLRLTGKRRISVAKDTDTVSHRLNRAASKIIGANIKAKRLAAGLTLEELCQRSGLVSATPKSRMWEIENAIRQEGVRMGTLYAIAKALKCEVADLLPTTAAVSKAAGVGLTTTELVGLSVVR